VSWSLKNVGPNGEYNTECRASLDAAVISKLAHRPRTNSAGWRSITTQRRRSPFSSPIWAERDDVLTLDAQLSMLRAIEYFAKSLEVTQGHCNQYHSKAWIRFPIRLPRESSCIVSEIKRDIGRKSRYLQREYCHAVWCEKK